jgi:hypothetical protein
VVLLTSVPLLSASSVRNGPLSNPVPFLDREEPCIIFTEDSEVEIPTDNLRIVSFTFLFWLYLDQDNVTQFIVGDWSVPGQFGIYVNEENILVFHLVFQLTGSAVADVMVRGPNLKERWVWSRS